MPLPLGSWTDERIADLKRYAEAGYSCSQIAALIGDATRNSVIGKLHRLGLSTSNEPGGSFKKTRKAPRPRMMKSRIAPTTWIASGSKVKLPYFPEELQTTDLVPLHILLVDLTINSCRFPYGAGPYTFCGHDTLGMGSYCDQHHRIVYRRPEDRRPRPPVAVALEEREAA